MRKLIKCIATDMDGTLLNMDQTISKENAEAIRTARKRGVEVIVCTGRSYEGARFPLTEAGLECFLICMNGAQIRTFDGEILSSIPLDPAIVRSVHPILEKYQIYYEMYTNKGQLSTEYEHAVATVADILSKIGNFPSFKKVMEGVITRFAKGKIKFVGDYGPIFSDPSYEIYKIIAFSLNEEKLERAREELQRIGGIAISSSWHNNLEITDIRAQKGIALETFVALKGWSLKETMAIGDNYNDVSMLERAGFSVAMGNAPEDIKKICHYVTDTNDNHGFSKAVYKILEMNEQAI
ncbi:Cof-type HAD-IIB family hydrolase [Caldibacillus debilis]|uniref:Cof-type HAD-IIB family hydrolase n=2 Tax=Caldibacillus debilis TaxID=301148 RepID=UPI00037D7D60|nr:Cof-type HAD-IIB family hydrolase [Caldibacillus debilis]